MALSDYAQLLADASELLREQYFDDTFHEILRPRAGMPAYFGWKTFPKMQGNWIAYQANAYPYTGARHGRLETALPDIVKASAIKVRWNVGASPSDVRRLAAGIGVTEEDQMIYSDGGSVVDLVDNLARQAKEDMTERLCQAVWGRSSGLLATLPSVALQVLPTPGALDTNTTDFKFYLDGSTAGNPNFFIKGMQLEFYVTTSSKYGDGASSAVTSYAIVTDVAPDASVKGKWWITVGLRDSTAPDASGGTVTAGGSAATFLAAGVNVYRRDEYGSSVTTWKCPYGIEDWFDSAVDTFRNEAGTQIDRSAAGNSWTLPRIFSANASSPGTAVDMALTYMDLLWPVIQRDYGGNKAPQGLVMLTDPEMWVNVKNLMKANGQLFQPIATMSKQYFGVDGLTDEYFIHPVCGPLALTSDVHAPGNKIRVLDPSTWGYLKASEPKWALGPIEGIWAEVTDTVGKRYLAYRADLYMFYQIINMVPVRNYELSDVKSTNT